MRSEQELVNAFKSTATVEQQSNGTYQQTRLLLEVLLDIRSLLAEAAKAKNADV